uniref:alpha/beta fold hydrolase n=1 Tax=Actinacidiphila rubida TaxID=310780 RepID=UPI000A85B80C
MDGQAQQQEHTGHEADADRRAARRAYEDTGVEVAGGRLAVRRWPGRPGAGTVLAVHGIASNGLAWTRVAEELDGVEVLAPDLRGRGLSRDVAGTSTMALHADDLRAVLDHFGVARAVLAGHSMGGFAACVAARRDPARYSGLVLVDGGLGFPVPDGVDIDAVLHAVIGPAMSKLEMTFADRAAYHAFWARSGRGRGTRRRPGRAARRTRDAGPRRRD